MLTKILLSVVAACVLASQAQADDIAMPPRLQWEGNEGYCGEVSLISAGLYYGQYMSQYDARAAACAKKGQNSCQLLLGKNDQTAAAEMHLNAIEWKGGATEEFLAWVKANALKGYPVAIAIYMNQYLFYGDTDPDAGDDEYDHIVPVFGIGSDLYSDDILYFSDNGLWGDDDNRPYIFSYPFNSFPASRTQANAENGPVYSLPDAVSNYGIAITGVKDLNGDTLPVRVATNLNYESPAIKDGSNTRPASEPLVLTVTVSGLQPHTLYNLYKYDNLASVPDANFNAHASDACKHWQIQVLSGDSYTLTESIDSDEIAVYRAVRASAL